MKKLILSVILTSMLVSTCLAKESSSPFNLEDGEKLKMYNKNGSYQGYYKKQGSKIKEYNRNGSYQGYYREQGSKIKHYNKNGGYEGYY